jgi:hypothetical protein
MPRHSFEHEAIETEIGRERSLGVDALRTLWCTTFRSSPPPVFSKDILARFLCWHVQEQAFCGLDGLVTLSVGLQSVTFSRNRRSLSVVISMSFFDDRRFCKQRTR